MDDNPYDPRTLSESPGRLPDTHREGLRIWDLIAKSEASAHESLLVQAQPR